MLKTNAKSVREAIRQHIVEYYPDMDDFTHDMRAAGGIRRMVEAGLFLVATHEIRSFLQTILQETEAEANKYDDQQVFKLYTNLIIMEAEKMLDKLGR